MPKPMATLPYRGKFTVPFLKVIYVFLENTQAQYAGVDITKKTGLQSGTVYPLLARLVEIGWLSAQWEKKNPSTERPPKRLYKLTSGGRKEALRMISENVSPKAVEGFGECATA